LSFVRLAYTLWTSWIIFAQYRHRKY